LNKEDEDKDKKKHREYAEYVKKLYGIDIDDYAPDMVSAQRH
jgi:hypothetical protein